MVSSGSGASSTELKAIIGFGLVGLAALVLLGSSFPTPTKTQAPVKIMTSYHGLPDYSLDPDAAGERLKEIARRAKGDYDLLSGDERNWTDSMSAGNGRSMLRLIYTEEVTAK